MPESDPPEFAELMGMWKAGDREAFKALIPLLYEELRRIARQQLRRAPSVRTLQTTALVHEAYMRLERDFRGPFQNKAHFMAVCALLMRTILVDYARNRGALKRGGGQNQCTLEDCHAVADGRPVDLLDLDRALTELARLDPEQARIVEIRFFGGLSIDEAAEALGISPATVKRHWISARVYLYQRLNGTAEA
jgi:RNA polymerase sigma factor (TIGR02999 family)